MSAEQSYPRLMWSPDGVEITVPTAEVEAEKRAEGYRVTAELPLAVVQADPAPETVVFDAQESDPPTFGASDDGTGEGPTEGAADDDTHEKKPKRKKA